MEHSSILVASRCLKQLAELQIHDNLTLTNLDGLSSVRSVLHRIEVNDNPALLSVKGLR